AGEMEVFRALKAGAVDVMAKPFTASHVQRIGGLFAELSERAPAPGATAHERLLVNLLAYYRRSQKSLALKLNPGTPFEGRAVFDRGDLAEAEFGPLSGREALAEMLWFEHGVWRIESAEERSQRPTLKLTALPPAEAPSGPR